MRPNAQTVSKDLMSRIPGIIILNITLMMPFLATLAYPKVYANSPSMLCNTVWYLPCCAYAVAANEICSPPL